VKHWNICAAKRKHKNSKRTKMQTKWFDCDNNNNQKFDEAAISISMLEITVMCDSTNVQQVLQL